MELIFAVSIACTVVSVICYGAQIPDCYQIYKKKNTHNIPFLPFIIGLVNTFAIFYYGFMRQDMTTLVVNTIGSIFQTSYVIIYILFTERKAQSLLQCTYACAFLAALYFYLHYVVENEVTAADRLGLITAVTSVSFSFAPLAEVADIVKSKSSSKLSVMPAVSMFVASLCWYVYGVLIDDIYIQLPCLQGILSSLIQFFLFWMYPSSSFSNEKTKTQ
ncbi:sugar transporter SWEET1-like [Saccoglossus kowalevskii]|uniref:Sugar transporter SWEET1 n=1 Tax=Saccoglossus kowalevskii TaxID=10224 RepID=A0ABM0LV70_SACKO|nr:PREDICTED: sugar transporter SWEET1-like [Saccoglossus kowalevskii]